MCSKLKFFPFVSICKYLLTAALREQAILPGYSSSNAIPLTLKGLLRRTISTEGLILSTEQT